jgi:AcrR family transcriptional regulator
MEGSMARATAEDRLPALVAAATAVFISKGYRRAQMADVSAAMGLSQGALYRYVESKEALFDLVTRATVAPDSFSEDLTLPVPTPKPGATLALVRDVLATESRMPALAAALETDEPASPRAELEAIVRELYRTSSRMRVGVKLIERSALDWPELAELWFGTARVAVAGTLADYLRRRIAGGLLRAVPDVVATARLIVETTAFFAIHHHWDPAPTPIDDDVAEATVVDNIVNAYASQGS